MFCNVIVKDKIEGFVCKWKGLRESLVAFVEELILQDAWIGINANVAGNSSAQIEVVLMVPARACSYFQDLIGRLDSL